MKKNILHIDFETRSVIDLTKAGAHVYSQDKTTNALCLGYAINDEPVQLWVLGQAFPSLLGEMLKRDDVIFAAHNAAFEYLIWNHVCVPKYGWAPLPLEKLDCTMVRAYEMGLPGSLEMAAKAVGMPFEKDMKGHRIMLQLCKPRKIEPDGTIVWWNSADSTPKLDIIAKYEALYRYCKQDIIVERELDKRLLPLSEMEKKLWIIDQKINNRGVYLDEAAALTAIEMVNTEQLRFNAAMFKMTKGEVKTCKSHIALRKWVNSKGVETESVDVSTTAKLLEGDLPVKVRNILLLRGEASKSSTSKLKAMIISKSKDNRVRGCFQFYGAASTGRWAGRRIQLQNLKRPDISQDEIELIMQKLGKVDTEEAQDYLNIFHGSIIKPISSCVRAMLTAAPGNELIAVDYTAIEGRVLAWLAGEEKTLNVFRGHGKIYEHTASQIYNVPMHEINKEQRLVGKVATLALGYQGGVGAFQSMSKQYFVNVPEKQAEEIKVMWRRANPNIVSYWYDIERCAIAAVENQETKFSCGPKGRHVTFMKKGSFLFCKLPSNRVICYPYPRMRPTKTPWGEIKNALNYKGTLYGKFVNRVAYGGLITENVTQAVARDLLAEALIRFEVAKCFVVMHVHDEIVFELKKGRNFIKPAEKLMCELPVWAKDLPVKAQGWQGERYRK